MVAGIVPLAAVCITLAEFLLDKTQPRWASPWFWIALATTTALLVLVNVLRYVKSSPKRPSKPDYSAASIVRRSNSPDRE